MTRTPFAGGQALYGTAQSHWLEGQAAVVVVDGIEARFLGLHADYGGIRQPCYACTVLDCNSYKTSVELLKWGVSINHRSGDVVVNDREIADSEASGNGQAGVLPKNEKDEVMCWKDETKVCRCLVPRLGVFCGRYPMPTD